MGTINTTHQQHHRLLLLLFLPLLHQTGRIVDPTGTCYTCDKCFTTFIILAVFISFPFNFEPYKLYNENKGGNTKENNKAKPRLFSGVKKQDDDNDYDNDDDKDDDDDYKDDNDDDEDDDNLKIMWVRMKMTTKARAKQAIPAVTFNRLGTVVHNKV